MNWQIDQHGRLVVTVTPEERYELQAQVGHTHFDSDIFFHDLLEPMVTNDEYEWLPEGSTGDLTSAPMLGVLGEEMPGSEDYVGNEMVGSGLVHVGCWEHEGKPRQFYRPVLKRWAFMNYAVTSPQRELAETGECVWDGGDLWTQEEAEKAVAMHKSE